MNENVKDLFIFKTAAINPPLLSSTSTTTLYIVVDVTFAFHERKKTQLVLFVEK